MPSIGFPELLVILMILLVVFGASRLPRLGESLGRSFGKLKRGMQNGQGPVGGDASGRDDVDDAEIIDK